MVMPRVLACLLAVVTLAASVLALGQGQGRQRLAGDVTAADNGLLKLRTTLGQAVEVKLPPGTRVTVRVPAAWSDIAPGSYVGTTAVPQPDGTLRAKEVHIFTDEQRGTGEGHYPMATPGDTMTNATVSSMSGARARDTMTNATVAAAAGGGDTHRLTLTYKGGEQSVVVPPGTPIVKSQPGDVRLLVPGAHVVAYAHRDEQGGLTAERISVGQGSFVPPI
jgi:hypothetical protein